MARRLALAVAGMGCPNCANRVRNALLAVPGVIEADVDLGGSVAHVWLRRESAPTPRSLVEAVLDASRGTHHRYLAVPLRSQIGQVEATRTPSPCCEERRKP